MLRHPFARRFASKAALALPAPARLQPCERPAQGSDVAADPPQSVSAPAPAVPAVPASAAAAAAAQPPASPAVGAGAEQAKEERKAGGVSDSDQEQAKKVRSG